MHALKSARHSLAHITLDMPFLSGRKALRMRDFAVLRSLRLNWDYQLFGRTSKKPRMHSVGVPPELETLEFLNDLGTDDEVTELLTYMIQSRAIVASNLKTMIVVESEEHPVPSEIVDACKEHGLQLDIIGRFDEEQDKMDAD